MDPSSFHVIILFPVLAGTKYEKSKYLKTTKYFHNHLIKSSLFRKVLGQNLSHSCAFLKLDIKIFMDKKTPFKVTGCFLVQAIPILSEIPCGQTALGINIVNSVKFILGKNPLYQYCFNHPRLRN